MPKGYKNPKPGRRVNIWIPPDQIEMADQIENLSRFVQIALDQAPDIMAWAILKKVDPKKYKLNNKIEEVIEEFNERHPLDPLTQKRQGKWQKRSPKIPDVLL